MVASGPLGIGKAGDSGNDAPTLNFGMVAKVPSERPLCGGIRRGRAATPTPKLSPDIVQNR